MCTTLSLLSGGSDSPYDDVTEGQRAPGPMRPCPYAGVIYSGRLMGPSCELLLHRLRVALTYACGKASSCPNIQVKGQRALAHFQLASTGFEVSPLFRVPVRSARPLTSCLKHLTLELKRQNAPHLPNQESMI